MSIVGILGRDISGCRMIDGVRGGRDTLGGETTGGNTTGLRV